MDFIPQLIEDITVLSPFKPEMFDLVLLATIETTKHLRASISNYRGKVLYSKTN